MITDGGVKVLLIENLPDDDEIEKIIENIGEEFVDFKNDTVKLATKEMRLKAIELALRTRWTIGLMLPLLSPSSPGYLCHPACWWQDSPWTVAGT